MHRTDLFAHFNGPRERCLRPHGAWRLFLSRAEAKIQALMAADDVTPCNIEVFGQLPDIQVGVFGSALWDGTAPQLKALSRTRHGELDHGSKSTKEGFVNVLLKVCGQDCAALEDFEALKQERDLLVCRSVLSLLDITTRAEEESASSKRITAVPPSAASKISRRFFFRFHRPSDSQQQTGPLGTCRGLRCLQ